MEERFTARFSDIEFEVIFDTIQIDPYHYDKETCKIMMEVGDRFLKHRRTVPDVRGLDAPEALYTSVTLCTVIAHSVNALKPMYHQAASFCFRDDVYDQEKGYTLALRRALASGFPYFATDPDHNKAMRIARRAIWEGYRASLQQKKQAKPTNSAFEDAVNRAADLFDVMFKDLLDQASYRHKAATV